MRKISISVLIHPATLIVSTLLVMAMAAVVAGTLYPAFIATIGAEASETDLALTDDIALILVTFGVFLEERELLAKRLFGEEMPARQHDLNEHGEFYGACLLLLGLVMEIVDQAFEPLLLENGFAVAGHALMLLFHIGTILICVGYLLSFRRTAEA